MIEAQSSLRHLRDGLHDAPKPPRWMQGVVATSVGTKITDGQTTAHPSIQFIVDEKLPKKLLSRSQIIPRTIDGVTTDVVRLSGELAFRDESAPAAALQAGFGDGFVSQSGSFGTIGCAGVTTTGPVYLTASHVIATRELAYLSRDTRPPVGTCVASVAQATGAQLYGDDANDPDEMFVVDLALLASRGLSQPAGGLPGGHPFLVFPNSVELAQHIDKAEVLTIGGASRLLHKGVVAGVWPRPAGVNLTGYCLIQHQPPMILGNSGAMWVARSKRGWVALGLHRSLVKRDGSRLSFVTDLAATARFLRVAAFLTTAGGGTDGGEETGDPELRHIMDN